MTTHKEVEPLEVKLPSSVAEAELMQKLGNAYLSQYAPEKLTAEYEQLLADKERYRERQLRYWKVLVKHNLCDEAELTIDQPIPMIKTPLKQSKPQSLKD